MATSQIVRCVIHPALGVARLGNADIPDDPHEWEKGFYIASDVPGRAATPGGGFKTRHGKIKRGAARFRIYGYGADGKVVKEITSNDAKITWRVHVANRKTAGYKFFNAMDLASDALNATYRNDNIKGALRQQLVNDPGPRTIEGNLRHGRQYRFNTGFVRFPDAPNNLVSVYLGELRTDEAGRLLFLGGVGRSGSVYNQPPSTFANNDGWYDDTSDGTVRATVVIDGNTIEAEPAMVAAAPPDYAPGIFPVVTMWDVVYDLHVREKWVEAPNRISFWEHIYPIFSRLVDNQWVNEGVYVLFGAGSPCDLTNPELLQQLSSPSEASKALRMGIFEWFRNPRQKPSPEAPSAMPPFYGDGYSEFRGTDLADLFVTRTQYAWLDAWARGDFVTGQRVELPARLEEYPLDQQPAALDRAPLEECLGGPFHPGIELTWTMRVARMWQRFDTNNSAAMSYRLRILPEGQAPRDDFGDVLTPEVALRPDGPTDGSGPGTLTRWQGVPWQTDEASCLSGYDVSTYLSLPSFWCARVPNSVLSEKAYKRVLATAQPLAQRMKHLSYRQFWLRDINSNPQDRRKHMVTEWDKLGIITEQPAPADYNEVGMPGRFWVETGRDKSFEVNDPTWNQVLLAEALTREPVVRDGEQAAEPALYALTPAYHPAATVEPDEVVGHPLRRTRDRGSL